MITRSHSLKLDLSGTLFQDYNKSSLLFFDIETTGFTARCGFIYLIGAISWQETSWLCTQWFAQSPEEEQMIIRYFLSFAKNRTLLVHFNGERFDIPFINEKCRHYHLGTSLSSINSRDLFRMIHPMKKLLGLSSLKQKSLEEYVGLHRKDPYSGGELISVYEAYQSNPQKELMEAMLQHNLEDLIGLASIVPLISYQVIGNCHFQIVKYEIKGEMLQIYARLPVILPVRLDYHKEFLTITGEKDQLILSVAGRQEALKYFYKDYKNYFYLPMEDTAIHKSLGQYMDKNFREPAKASNCYTKKSGYFLPQREEIFSPVFKTDYSDKQLYFQCNEKFLANPENIPLYVKHLLSES